MSIGYQGAVLFQVLGSSLSSILATGATFTSTDRYIKSSSGFNGPLGISYGGNSPIDLPLDVDFSEVSGNVSFEVNPATIGMIINMVGNRSRSFGVTLVTKDGGYEQYNTCYWSDISLSGTAGSLVTGSIGVYAVKMDSYRYGEDFSKYGNQQLSNQQGYANQPIPFWSTTVIADGSSIGSNLTDWNISLNQTINKFYGCPGGNLSTPSAPISVAVGPVSGTFGGNLILHSPLSFTPFTKQTNNVIIGVGGHNLNMTLMRDGFEDPIVQGSNLAVMPLKYFMRGISFS